MDYEEYKRKALEPIVNYIESVMASYSKEELEALIKKALPEKESEDERIRNEIIDYLNFAESHNLLRVADYKKKKGWLAYLESQKKQTTKTDACGFLRDKGQLGCMKKEDVLNDMLKATTEEQKQRVLEIFDIKNETCCHFPCDTESEDYSEFDDRVYLDGDITFDKMAAVVDYLRACNPEKEVNRLEEGRKSLRPRPHWKPSEEQMEALMRTITWLVEKGNHTDSSTLADLRRNLQKLM